MMTILYISALELAKDLVVDELLNIAKNQLDSSVRACRYVLDLGEESR